MAERDSYSIPSGLLRQIVPLQKRVQELEKRIEVLERMLSDLKPPPKEKKHVSA